MLFNSVSYVIFLPIIVLIYFLIPQKARNLFLLIASYYFYACWMPKYLILIIIPTLLTYFISILMDKLENDKKRKLLLFIGIFINLAILFVFKYFDFFTNNINDLFKLLNININLNIKWSILLPVGISFYIFQSIGYCIDVYRKDVEVEKNIITYALFISFFPQLVAGPIERSKNLLKQFHEKHSFSYENAVCGMRYIIVGMFRKVVIADLTAVFVNAIYNNVSNYTGLTLIFATLLFAIQIYCDFSGYSMIAIGSAKILGFDLMENFKSPYFSQNISEFWNRWHISLSTWFRDYLYIPLGGNRKGFKRKLINIFIIFLASGLWHGAAWTFIIWGLLHAFYRLVEEIYKKYFNNSSNKFKNLKVLLKIACTFFLVCFAWIFFRANGINDAFYVIKSSLMITSEGGSLRSLLNNIFLIINTSFFNSHTLRYFIIFIMIFGIIHLILEDYIMYKNNYNISSFYQKLGKFRYIDYYILTVITIFVFVLLNAVYGQTGQFIYFQF